MIHVDHGQPEHLGRLVRALLREYPDIDVFTDVRAVLNVAPGSVFILVPKPEDADWLNLNRPIFAQRQIKVVLYCDYPTTLALADRAVDFFDWVSQHHVCPGGPPDFAVQGFRKAVAANAPGIVWTGAVDGLVRVFEAAFPGETLQWVFRTGHHNELARRIQLAGDAWVAYRAHDAEHVYPFRLAVAIVGKWTRTIMLMAKPRSPAWWPLNDACLTLDASQSLFREAGMCHPGRLAALTGLEKETVELARQLLNSGVEEADLLATLCDEADPGVAVAKKAHRMNGVGLPAVALRIASAPLLRALDDAPEVSAIRETFIEAVKLGQGEVTRVLSKYAVKVSGNAPSSDAFRWMRRSDWKFFLREWQAEKTATQHVDLRLFSSADPLRQKAHTSTLELPQETIASLGKGNYVDVLKSFSKQRRKRGPFRQYLGQIRARVYLDIRHNQGAESILRKALDLADAFDGPSTPLFAELMVDMALLLHRKKGDASTAFALLRKLLGAELASLHVDTENASEASAKPTRNTSVDDFIHLFLAQSNSPPPLPPESKARALRILAEVLLSQGRYEEVEEVAQRAHETAIHASEIARPETWRGLALLGRARALQGRHAEGKNDLEKAIELATSDFGKNHAEVARLWLDLARLQARHQDTETIRNAIDCWKDAQCDDKERTEALEELRRMAP